LSWFNSFLWYVNLSFLLLLLFCNIFSFLPFFVLTKYLSNLIREREDLFYWIKNESTILKEAVSKFSWNKPKLKDAFMSKTSHSPSSRIRREYQIMAVGKVEKQTSDQNKKIR
jgi:hypothetical protein